MTMRLLTVIPDFRTGGAQRLLADLLPLMARRDDFDITLAVYADPGQSGLFAALRQNPHIKIRILGVPIGRPSHFNPLARRKAVRNLRRLMEQADVCHVHLFPALYDAALAARGLDIRLIFTDHSTSNLRRHIPFLAPIEKIVYSKYDRILCISPAALRSLTDWLRTDPADPRFHVVRNGILTENFDFSSRGGAAAAEEFHLPESESELLEMYEGGPDADLHRRMKRAAISSVKEVLGRNGHAVLMVSRFAASKDHPSLIKALSILKNDPRYTDRIPSDTFLAFAGTGPMMESCRRLAIETGVADDVLFLGDRADIPRLTAAASAGAQISHWEGFGLTACELLAAGTPLVVSDIPGLADITEGGARRVGKQDPEAIAAALADILAPLSPDDFNDTLVMQAEGIRTARRHHLTHTLERYLELYRK